MTFTQAGISSGPDLLARAETAPRRRPQRFGNPVGGPRIRCRNTASVAPLQRSDNKRNDQWSGGVDDGHNQGGQGICVISHVPSHIKLGLCTSRRG